MNSTPHAYTPAHQTRVQAWLLALGAGLFFWVVTGSFLLFLVW